MSYANAAIYATTADVGATVTFHARGRERTGLVLEVKGIKALIRFQVTPDRGGKYGDDGVREQWIRFDRPKAAGAELRAAKAAVTTATKRLARAVREQADYDARIAAGEVWTSYRGETSPLPPRDLTSWARQRLARVEATLATLQSEG